MDLESRLLRVPATLAGGPEQSPLKGQLKEAKRQLADAEGRLRKAEAEAEAAHKEVR